MAQPADVRIKGIRQGLLINLGTGEWPERLSLLEQRLAQSAGFFQGGRAVLDVGDRLLTPEEIEQARDLLARHEVALWGLLSPCDETALAAARMGLAVHLDLAEPAEPKAEAASEPERDFPTLLVERNLRSGQKVHHPGHVVIVGDVHAGAEVVAGGHIIVWGKVRGVVHAGAMGDSGAMVCALDLSPTQLRIAGYIARSPEEKRRRPMPETARVRDGRIEAIPWREK